MNLPNPRRTPRAGFTLVEMMLVVVIVGILATLISAAAVKAVAKAKQARNANDIRQLSVAVENFKSKFGFYPPSKIKLCERFVFYLNASGAPATQLDADSIQYLQRMFPRIDMTIWNNPSPNVGINWSGNYDYTTNPPTPIIEPGFVVLEGNECLVFFLGGIPGGGRPDRQPNPGPPPSVTPPACLGFSTNPNNPTVQTADRIGPFYEFQSGRLVPQPPAVPVFYSYQDTYGTPFAYFGSYKTTNNYNRYFPLLGNSDCQTLGVWPYMEAPGRFLNPNTFQIISAGADKKFGPGSPPPTGPTWTPANASLFYPDGSDGRDDQSNFYDSLLGAESK